MGLDMYLNRVTRLTDDEKKLVEENEDKTVGNSFTEFVLTGINGNPIYIKGEIDDIMPFMHVIEVQKKHWSETRLKRHFGIPDGAYRVSEQYSHEGNVWTYKLDDKYFNVVFNDIKDNVDEFIDIHVVKCGYFKISEVAYWRKEYDLDEMLCKAYDGEVRNCGYHKLNDEMRKIILEHESGNIAECDIEDTEDSVVCYHQWY